MAGIWRSSFAAILDDPDLYISIIDESGTEVHREKVYAGMDRQRTRRAFRVVD